MSKDFEWRTEDHEDWGSEPGGDQPTPKRRQLLPWLRRHSRWVGAAAVLLLITGLAIYSVLNRRVEQAEDATKADVLAVHGLVRQAAFEKDFDLLSVVMVGDDQDWAMSQLELLNVGLFIDRAPLGLELARENVAQTVKQSGTLTVTLSPDLQTAEVVEQFPYTVTGGEHISETVWLEQRFFYRRQAESWLLMPMPDDEAFWGRWRNLEGSDLVTMVYPRRDEDFAIFLAEKIDGLVGQICVEDGIECPVDFNLEFRLNREESRLRMLNDSVLNIFLTPAGGIYHFSLPAPTLVGRPVDEAGREALYRGYASWLAAVMLSRYRGEQFVLNQDVEEKLISWGLELPPEPALVLPISEPVAQPPVPFPEQDVLLACSNLRSLSLMRYNPRANRWIDEIGDAETTYLSSQIFQFSGSLIAALPDDSGVLVSINHIDSPENNLKLVLWREGQEKLWLESDVTLQLVQESIQRQFDPSGRYMIVFDTRSSASSQQVIPYVIDTVSCLSGDCQVEDYQGFPYWSPDLSWAVSVEPSEQSRLRLWNNETGEVTPLGSGFSPFWGDNETFYYIRTEGDPDAGFENAPNVQIVSARVSDPLNISLVLESADIATAINEENPAEVISVQQAVVHPEQRDWVFIFATAHSSITSRENYLLAYQRTTGEVSVVSEFNDRSLTGPLLFSPDGRYLMVPTYDSPPESSIAQASLNLIPLQPDTMTTGVLTESYEVEFGGYSYDLSQDGQWLMTIHQGAIRLIAPGQSYEQTISHDIDQYCQAVWIDALSN